MQYLYLTDKRKRKLLGGYPKKVISAQHLFIPRAFFFLRKSYLFLCIYIYYYYFFFCAFGHAYIKFNEALKKCV